MDVSDIFYFHPPCFQKLPISEINYSPLPRFRKLNTEIIICGTVRSFLVEKFRLAQNASANDQANRFHVLLAAPRVYQPFGLGPLVTKEDTKRRTLLWYCPTSVLSSEEVPLRLVRHQTAVDHCSLCRWAHSTVANSRPTTESAFPCTLSGNSSDLKLASASRFTFSGCLLASSLTFYQCSRDSNLTQSRRLLARTGGLIGSPRHK